MNFRNQVLSGMGSAELALLRPHLVECQLAKEKVLYEPGGPVEAVYFPSTAVTSVVTVMRDGRCIEAATVGRESLVGAIAALSGSPSHTRIFVQVAGTAYRLPAPAFRDQAYRSPMLMQRILRHFQQDAAQSEQSGACNALHTVIQRLAKWLLLSQDRIGGDIVPLTQEHLGIMLGVQRTTVTAAALSLKKAGLLKYWRGQIRVTDRAGLERASCECYAAITAFGQADFGPAARLSEA
jgi:CRP-like cAMP-binding protein